MASKIRAVVFDFNGTLFDDTEFHNQAWTEFAARYGKLFTPDELDRHIHGFTNREILEYIFQKPLKKKELEALYEEKEQLYRDLCKNQPERCILTNGAGDFLEFLLRNNIPRTIATASYLPNIHMYFSMFALERWFNPDHVIYDTGTYRGKPFPDMFLAAADRLGIPVADCMIIEDSKGGIQAAKNAGAGKIIAVDFKGTPNKFSQFPFIDSIIHDFRELKSFFK